MQRTSIEWVRNADGTQGHSANPIRARHRTTGKVGWHCDKVSPGCTHCYAEAIDTRFGTGEPYTRAGGKNVDLFLDESMLQALVRRRTPTTVFLGDMTDLFQPAVTDAMLDRLFAYLTLARQHTIQILTKRAARMAGYFRREHHWGCAAAYRDLISGAAIPLDLGDGLSCWPPHNVWPGVSVENQDVAEGRIGPLLTIAEASVRFLSVEPLLGPVDLGRYLHGLSWVIVGGESGPGARPMEPAWARTIRDQCVTSNVPFFFKQWGGVNKKSAGRLLDGRLWNEMPERGERLVDLPWS
jgi:protein gp37